MKETQRILTGDRPTGPLHIGHLVGHLQQNVLLQDEFETFMLVADLHVLTTKPDGGELAKNILELMRTYVAVGLDPAKVTFFVQSAVPAISELAIILSNFITVNRLQRVPTLKEVMHDLHIEQPPLGLLGYPVLMAADILSFKAGVVPVGEDQVAHLEVARELVRRLNGQIGEALVEPKPRVSESARLPGTDGGAKMSKSLGNTINLFDDEDALRRKVMSMYTDPNRLHATDPGKVEGNPVFLYHDAFNRDTAEVKDLKQRYERGGVGDVEVKQKLFVALNEVLTPIRERGARFTDDQLSDILRDGTQRAQVVARDTLAEVKRGIGLGGDLWKLSA